jgi:thiamine kinase-like enzyme
MIEFSRFEVCFKPPRPFYKVIEDCCRCKQLFHLKKVAPSNIAVIRAIHKHRHLGIHIMTIRGIAKELYRLQQQVERLQKKIENTSRAKREEIEQQLRKAKAERDRLRRILDGQLDR